MVTWKVWRYSYKISKFLLNALNHNSSDVYYFEKSFSVQERPCIWHSKLKSWYPYLIPFLRYKYTFNSWCCGNFHVNYIKNIKKIYLLSKAFFIINCNGFLLRLASPLTSVRYRSFVSRLYNIISMRSVNFNSMQ